MYWLRIKVSAKNIWLERLQYCWFYKTFFRTKLFLEQLQNLKDVRSIQNAVNQSCTKLANKIHVIFYRMPPQNQSSSQSRRTPTPTKQVSLRSVSRREEDSQGYEETIDMEELRQSLSRENSRWISNYGLKIVCMYLCNWLKRKWEKWSSIFAIG